MGDEHRIQAARHGGIGGRAGAGERADARAQHRVGQQAPAAELEQDGRVPDPREAVPGGIYGRRVWWHESILAYR